jgi:glutathione S-transferase
MKFYDSPRTPNPRRVRIYLAEKGLPVPPVVWCDIMKGEHLTGTFAGVNPWQRVPALELDDGTVIAESIAICRYFEELHPDPPLFGEGAVGKALVEMWNRRVELGLLAAVASAFRHLHPAMQPLEVPQVALWGEANKAKAMVEVERLDSHLKDHRFLAGDRFSVADITAMTAIGFMKPARLAIPDTALHLQRWFTEVSARPSMAA